MVLDLTREELDRLKSLLEENRQRGVLAYGLHESESALLTCLEPLLETPPGLGGPAGVRTTRRGSSWVFMVTVFHLHWVATPF